MIIPSKNLENKICTTENCNAKIDAKGLCAKHYQRLKRNGSPDIVKKKEKQANLALCSVEKCMGKILAKTFCNKHYKRDRKYGSPDILQTREKGTGNLNPNGYIYIGKKEKIFKMHRIVAEKALGKPLPYNAIVHHINGNKSDNRQKNLVICQDQAYHFLLHVREKALIATGDPNKRKCSICKEYDNKFNLDIPETNTYRHKKCMKNYMAQRYKNKKEKR